MSINFHKTKLSRLKLNEKYLTKFDLVEKNPQLYNLNYSNNNLNAIIIQSKACLSSSKLYILSLGIWLELLGTQRFLIQQSANSKKFSKIFYLKITIRKNKIFTFLELCLNSIFLSKLNNLACNQDELNQKVYFFLPSNIINNLKIILSNSCLITFLTYFKQYQRLETEFLIPLISK